MRTLHAHLLVTVLFACLVGCGGDTLRVDSLQLGRSLNADSTVAVHSTTFAPTDTVYVSVITGGVGSGTLGVRWMFGGQVLGEPKKQVSSKDGANIEFHLESAAGFPVGDYSAEVFFDGQSVGKRPFRVEKR
jgi:hypothetical protein